MRQQKSLECDDDDDDDGDDEILTQNEVTSVSYDRTKRVSGDDHSSTKYSRQVDELAYVLQGSRRSCPSSII